MTRRDRITRRRAKGLWTETRWRSRPSPRLSAGISEVRRAPALQIAYKPAEPVKVAVDCFGLKPYWGKPAVRNFREVRGNVLHGLATICHAARKGGDTGSHWPTQITRLFPTRRAACKAADPAGVSPAAGD